MTHPKIFELFNRVECTSDGTAVLDFLGGAINASYKHTWERNVFPKGKTFKPSYPALSEWTIDWIASLLAAYTAGNEFRVVELGAGYGQWMVTAILAYRSKHQGSAYGVAVEADPTHYNWLHEHVQRNLGDLDDIETVLIHAAAGLDGFVEFPVVDDPSKDYGAAYARSNAYEKTVKIPCMSVSRLYDTFDNAPVDLVHIDIQGAEADLIADPTFGESLQNTKMILFGTHTSAELHGQVRESLLSAGFDIKIDWPRSSTVRTDFGTLNTNDGALFAVRSDININDLFDFGSLEPQEHDESE